MTLEQTQKETIDKMSLVEILRIWRFSNDKNTLLRGDVGKYFSRIMYEKRDADTAAWVHASKQVGW